MDYIQWRSEEICSNTWAVVQVLRLVVKPKQGTQIDILKPP